MADTTAATKTRLEKAVIHRDLKMGRVTLEQLLDDVPPCLLNVTTIIIVDMIPYVGTSAIAELNYEAIRRGINLALPMGALTARARRFLVKWDRERRAKREKNASSK